MRCAKFVAIAVALSLCLPALTWARGQSAQPQLSQAEIHQVQERLQELGYYEGAIAGSAAVGAAIGGPVGLAAGALGASLWTQLRNAF